MFVRALATLTLTLCVAPSLAQVPAAFVGSWKLTWEGERRPQAADLTIAANGTGSWKTAAHSRNNACLGREVPISVEQTAENEIKVKLRFAETLAGCADESVTLIQSSGNAISGTKGSRAVTVVKQ